MSAQRLNVREQLGYEQGVRSLAVDGVGEVKVNATLKRVVVPKLAVVLTASSSVEVMEGVSTSR